MRDMAGDEMLLETTTHSEEPPQIVVPTDPFPHNPTERFPERVGDTVGTHVLTSQDTLRNLAKQYLGNSNRWQEILDLNSRLLPNPYQLPVGTRIQIPRKLAAVSEKPQLRPQNRSLQLPQARPARQPAPTTDTTPGEVPLVPVVRSPAVLE